MFYTYYPPTIHRFCLLKINVVDDIPLYLIPIMTISYCGWLRNLAPVGKLVANYVKDFQLITLVNNTSWK